MKEVVYFQIIHPGHCWKYNVNTDVIYDHYSDHEYDWDPSRIRICMVCREDCTGIFE